MINVSYADMRGAKRAAERLALVDIDIVRNDEGRFEIHSKPVDIAPMKPVAYLWAYFAQNRDAMTRPEMKRAMKLAGFNAHTVNTQAHKFFRAA